MSITYKELLLKPAPVLGLVLIYSKPAPQTRSKRFILFIQ
jgi:hypothetical protein